MLNVHPFFLSIQEPDRNGRAICPAVAYVYVSLVQAFFLAVFLAAGFLAGAFCSGSTRVTW
jgi:hypothetical protein